jgi:hypothetical protein
MSPAIRCHGVARRHRHLGFARLRDFAVERRAAFLLGQEALLQQLADDALDRFRQAPLPLPPPDRPGVRSVTGQALPGATDQDIYLSPGQAQRLGCLIGGFMPDHLKRCQWPDDFRPVPGLRPCLVGQGGHALRGNRWSVDVMPKPRFGAHEY